ncbi:MAG TPA: tetratricopeptide repeat protein [Candidatus Acidoferrales bacterium]|nr:tetratricopeptide repeat protein [Candidatus Acidoferrales bacterium]
MSRGVARGAAATRGRVAWGALVACALAGCSSPHAPAAAAHAPDSTLRSQALIDSGNAAYRGGDFEGAAKRYASAAAVVPRDPAAWYGLGMALSKLGRGEESREAYSHARALLGRAPDSSAAHE